MKTLSVADLKSQFSMVISDLREGREILITYGRNKEPLATIIPQSKLKKPDYSIPIGDLKLNGWKYTMNDFELTDNDLLSL